MAPRFMEKGLVRKMLEERMRKGPLLRKLREEFFRAASKVYDAKRFEVQLLDDIKEAERTVVVISPFLNKTKVECFINSREVKEALERGVNVIVVTRPAAENQVGNIDEHKECIEILRENGVRVFEQEKLHFKSVMIDDTIIYLGSINPLSVITVKYVPPDYMVRFESEALVDEIIENALGRETYERWLSS